MAKKSGKDSAAKGKKATAAAPVSNALIGLTIRLKTELELSGGSLTEAQLEERLEQEVAKLGPMREKPLPHYQLATLLYEHVSRPLAVKRMEHAVHMKADPDWLAKLAYWYTRPPFFDYSSSLRYNELVLDYAPTHPGAMKALINSGARTELNWPRLWSRVRAVLNTRAFGLHTMTRLNRFFTNDDAMEGIEEFVEEIEAGETDVRFLSNEVLEFLAIRTLFAYRFSLGYRIRAVLARRIVKKSKDASLENPAAVPGLVRGYVYQDKLDEALRVAEKSKARFVETNHIGTLRKLHADVSLLHGNAEPLQKYHRGLSAEHPNPDDARMKKLIKGKRVAIVGPVDTGENLGSVIEEFDVIVRPGYLPSVFKHRPEVHGSRTTISYYSHLDSQKLTDEELTAMRDKGVKLVVLRSNMTIAAQKLPEGFLRYMDGEPSIYLRRFPNAVQRAIFDIERFEPAEIECFGMDMYSNGSGSRMEKLGFEGAFVPGTRLNPAPYHDWLFDFKVMHHFYTSGLIKARGITAQAFAMSPQEYVERLDQLGQAGTEETVTSLPALPSLEESKTRREREAAERAAAAAADAEQERLAAAAEAQQAAAVSAEEDPAAEPQSSADES